MVASLLQSSPKRRDKLVIMAEIIGIAKVGALKTQIMYKANLSFEQLSEYLHLLMQKKLLERTACDGRDVYRATQKGVSFAEMQNALKELLK